MVGPGDADISQITPVAAPAAAAGPPRAGPAPATGGTESGRRRQRHRYPGHVGDTVSDGDPILIVEAMKMETEVRANASGTLQSIAVKKGDAIAADQLLMTIG